MSRTTIVVGEVTSVTVKNLRPPDLEVTVVSSDTDRLIDARRQCPNGSSGQARSGGIVYGQTYRFRGCTPGQATIELQQVSNNGVLESVDITVTSVLPTPPTVEFSESSYSVNEGSSRDITVNLSRTSSRELTIPIEVAQSSDYSVSGLTSDDKISFSSGETSKSFTISANEDSDCSDETVNLGFGTLPSGVLLGSQSSATLTIEDDDTCVEFSESSYSVNEGSNKSITVRLSPTSSQSLMIPIEVAQSSDYSVSGLTSDDKISFSRGETSKSFTINTNEDSDCSDETVSLGFGTLPSGVLLGSQSSATLTIDDNDSSCPPTPTNVPPTFDDGASATREVEENKPAGEDVGTAVSATDPDNDNLTYSLAGGTGLDGTDLATVLSAFEIDNDDGQLTTRVPLNHEGTPSYLFQVHVSDGRGGTDEIDVTVNVKDVNEAPTAVQIAGQTLTVGGSTDIDLSDKFSDPDTGDTLIYSASSSDTGVVTASATGSSLTLTPIVAGSTTVEVTATDTSSLSVLQSFAVAVEPSMAFGSPPSNITVGQPHSFSVNVSGTVQGVKYKVSSSLAPDDETAGFNQDCKANSAEAVFDGTAATVSKPFTLHGCREATGLTLNAKLLQDTGVNPNDFTWADVKTISTTFSVSATAPGPPLNLTVTPGDGSLEVEWTKPSDKGGADILQYKVQHRSTPSSPSQWPSSTLINTKQVGKGTTEVTIEGLTYGESYDVRVQACNVVGCGAWSASVSGTPTLPSLAKPVIDVKPLPLRKAEISWTGDTNASEYVVEIREPISGSSKSMDETTTSLEVDLDDMVSGKGLADADEYVITVTAKDTRTPRQYLDNSDAAMLIDNPIYRADGDSRSRNDGNGQATLLWNRDPNALDGEYTIRYWRLRRSIDESWVENTTWRPMKTDNVGASTKTDPRNTGEIGPHPKWLEHTIGNGDDKKLDLEEIYAIQLYYDTSAGRVFSARDVYVWPSKGFPDHMERIATYPFFGHWPNKEYRYIICDTTFPDVPSGNRTKWVNLITHAFGQWQAATDGEVSMIPVIHDPSDPDEMCSDPTGAFDDFVASDDSKNEVRMIDPPMVESDIWSFPEIQSDVFKVCLLDARACVTSFSGYSGTQWKSGKRRLLAQILEKYTSGMAEIEDLSFLFGTLKLFASHKQQASQELQSVDVVFNKRSFFNKNSSGTIISAKHDPNIPNIPNGDAGAIEPGEIRFHTCIVNNVPDPNDDLQSPQGWRSTRPFYAYATAVHEAGHALGLSNVTYEQDDIASQPYDVAHPTIPDTVLNYDRIIGVYEPDCSLHPFDVMAIYALYQTVSVP